MSVCHSTGSRLKTSEPSFDARLSLSGNRDAVRCPVRFAGYESGCTWGSRLSWLLPIRRSASQVSPGERSVGFASVWAWLPF
jgi:hypothetical protein